jgi:hypothetical protein
MRASNQCLNSRSLTNPPDLTIGLEDHGAGLRGIGRFRMFWMLFRIVG